MATGRRLTAELRRSVALERGSLQLLDFIGLASGHLVNQLLNGLGRGLTYLYKLHGRKNSTVAGAAKSPVGRNPGTT